MCQVFILYSGWDVIDRPSKRNQCTLFVLLCPLKIAKGSLKKRCLFERKAAKEMLFIEEYFLDGAVFFVLLLFIFLRFLSLFSMFFLWGGLFVLIGELAFAAVGAGGDENKGSVGVGYFFS